MFENLSKLVSPAASQMADVPFTPKLQHAATFQFDGLPLLCGTVTLTVRSEKVVVELEEREAVPGVHGLDVQRGVHVGSVQRQKGLGVFGHQLGPP